MELRQVKQIYGFYWNLFTKPSTALNILKKQNIFSLFLENMFTNSVTFWVFQYFVPTEPTIYEEYAKWLLKYFVSISIIFFKLFSKYYL